MLNRIIPTIVLAVVLSASIAAPPMDCGHDESCRAGEPCRFDQVWSEDSQG